MIKGKSTAFQFYPADFLSDENVVLMSNVEVGCYIKLLCFCWKQGSIPANIDLISRLCNEPYEKMAELWPSIEPCFHNGQPDRLIHPRLEIERKKQENFSKERSESGKKGAKKRWENKDKDGSAIQQPLAKGNKQPLAKDGFSSSSLPSVSKKKGIKIFIPPTEKEVIKYFQENGYLVKAAYRAFRYYDAANWKDGNGKQVKNWKQKMIGVWFKEENKDTVKITRGSSKKCQAGHCQNPLSFITDKYCQECKIVLDENGVETYEAYMALGQTKDVKKLLKEQGL
jgi:uncharacterized protein YdaU (DUF1376 family)